MLRAVSVQHSLIQDRMSSTLLLNIHKKIGGYKAQLTWSSLNLTLEKGKQPFHTIRTSPRSADQGPRLLNGLTWTRLSPREAQNDPSQTVFIQSNFLRSKWSTAPPKTVFAEALLGSSGSSVKPVLPGRSCTVAELLCLQLNYYWR